MPDLEKRKLFWLRYLVAVVLLAGIMFSVPIREIRNALKACLLMLWIAAFAILLVGRVLASVRTKAITEFLYLMIVSLELRVSLIRIGWVRAFAVFMTAVPMTPSGLGVREVIR